MSQEGNEREERVSFNVSFTCDISYEANKTLIITRRGKQWKILKLFQSMYLKRWRKCNAEVHRLARSSDDESESDLNISAHEE